MMSIVIAIYLSLFSGNFQNDIFKSRSSTDHPYHQNDTQKESVFFGKREARIHSIDAKKKLVDFKNRWILLKTRSQGGILTKEHQDLAKECASQLLGGEDWVRLMEFLNENEMDMFIGMMYEEMAIVYQSELGSEARELLAKLPDIKSPDGISYREKLSYAAGRGCSESELKELCSSLLDPASAQNAVLGYNAELARSDPKSAVSDTVRLILKDQFSSMIILGIEELFGNLDDSTNFKELEILLPIENSVKEDRGIPWVSPLEAARKALLRRWALVDPTAAVNYIISNPNRINPDGIVTVVSEVMLKDPLAGFRWIQEFPDGPYFDAAAYASIPYISDSYPEEALKLAKMIEDLRLQSESIKIIESKRKANRTIGN